MNVSATTIPQIFYDFIARVLPGFIFTCVLLFIIRYGSCIANYYRILKEEKKINIIAKLPMPV